MKFLIIGLGSMGKRRIRCLLELGIPKEDILGYDLKEERREEANRLGVITLPKLAIPLYKDMVLLVCTPPDKHLEYLQIASDYKIPCFVEASVCIGGLEAIENKEYIYPSATMRFSNQLSTLKIIKDSNNICYFNYYCSSYLPDWHPSEDITTFYVSKKETGACREMVPFELEWLVWMFGDVKTIKGIIHNTHQFGEIDDIYEILLEFESGIIGHVRIDIISRFAKGGKRKIVFVPIKTIIDDIPNLAGTECTLEIRIIEYMYILEIKHFIASVEGKETYHYTLEDDIKILKLLEEIENDNSDNTCSCGK